MKKIIQELNIITSYLNENKDRSFYIAVLRIYVSFHIFRNSIVHFGMQDLIMGKDSIFPLYYSNKLIILAYDNHNLLLFFMLAICILFAFGIGKNITAIILYSTLEIYNNTIPYLLNGGDNFLKFIVLYLIFADSYQYFSISKLNLKNYELRRALIFLTNLATYSILIHLCLIYFISAIEKIHTDEWFNGVAFYYIMNLERFTGTPFNKVLAQNGYIVNIVTYVTMLWELYFPLLVWVKKMRVTVIVMGVIMHVGIMITMMLYDFQLLYIVTLGLFFKNDFYFNFFDKVNNTYIKLRNKYILSN